jgi:hypothetical protein
MFICGSSSCSGGGGGGGGDRSNSGGCGGDNNSMKVKNVYFADSQNFAIAKLKYKSLGSDKILA